MSATVRTFRAPDSTSALAAVKAALGPDAILISSRTVEGGLFRRPEVEVTAASGPLIEPPAPPPLPAKAAHHPAAAPAAAAAFAPRAYRQAERTTAIHAERLAAPTELHAARSIEDARSMRPPDDALASEVHLLRRSVEEARRALTSVTLEARAGHDLQIPPKAAQAHARLVGRGVEPILAEELVRQALSLTSARSGSLTDIVRDLVSERLVPCRAPWLHSGHHVIALVGPTGVGKTTTLAKIAARALLEAKKRVALLTVDTYRIGACDQLARYGEIMGAPVLVARGRSELLQAYERVKDADLVLIDTAGRSSAEDVARQAELVRAIPRVQLHLVVSAATGALELAAIGDRYRGLQPDRLLFSKLDEAAGPGAVLSVAVRIARPVSCITNGQRVPEDLHALSGPQLADLVLMEEPCTK